jgi:hypothetical protein
MVPDHIDMPLSFEQEWFYQMHRLKPYVSFPLTLGFEITGHFDVSAFRQAINTLIERHQAMRSAIIESAHGEVLERVTKYHHIANAVICQHVKCETRTRFHAVVRALAQRDQQAPWDLSGDPPYRLRLLRYSQADHVFLATLNHIAFDGSALGLFKRELWSCYARYVAGDETGVTSPASELTTAIRRQHERYAARAVSASARYWDEQIATMPPIWQPSRGVLTREPGSAGRNNVRLVYDATQTEQLRLTCHNFGCSVFELMLAVFAWLTFSLTKQDRIAIYSPVDSRDVKAKNLMGMFSYVHPIVLDRRAGGPLGFLPHVRSKVFRSRAHHHVRGGQNIEATMRLWSRWRIEPERSLAINYIKQDADPGQNAEMLTGSTGVRVRQRNYAPVIPVKAGSLGLTIYDSPDVIRVMLAYNPSFISDTVASGLLASFDYSLRLEALAQSVTYRDRKPRPLQVGEFVGDWPEWDDAVLTPLSGADGVICMHVNLAEIQTILLQHPCVLAAALAVEDDVGRGSEIVASLRTTARLREEELQQFVMQWPRASSYAISPTRIKQVLVSGPSIAYVRGADATIHVDAACSHPQDFEVLLGLLTSLLPGASLESEFWQSGGTFSLITEIIRRAEAMGLPKPCHSDFAIPRTLATVAASVVARAGRANSRQCQDDQSSRSGG